MDERQIFIKIVNVGPWAGCFSPGKTEGGMDDCSDGAGVRGKYVLWKIFPPYWVGDITKPFGGKYEKWAAKKGIYFLKRKKEDRRRENGK